MAKKKGKDHKMISCIICKRQANFSILEHADITAKNDLEQN
jgi:hypothetical protein